MSNIFVNINSMDVEYFDLESCGDGYYRNHESLFGVLSELRSDGKFCDAVIKVAGLSYPIHRNVMSACSPYFKTLFTSSAFNTCKKEMLLPGVPAVAVGMMIDFAYSRTVRITPENIELIFHVADQYHVTGLLKLCCGYLIRNLTQDNSLGVLRFAKKHQCHGLEKSAPRFTLKHFSQICTQSNEFVQLPIDLSCPIPSSDPLINVMDWRSLPHGSR